MAHGKYAYTTETFADGTCKISKVGSSDFIKLDAGDCPAEIQSRLMAHGLLQKVTDQTNKEKGDRLAAMVAIYKRLVAGEWAAERVGGAPTVSAWIEAVARLCKGSIAEAQKTVAALTEDDKAKLKANPRVQKMTEEIMLQRGGSKGLDVSGLLG